MVKITRYRAGFVEQADAGLSAQCDWMTGMFGQSQPPLSMESEMGKMHKIMLVGKSGVGKDAFADALWNALSFGEFLVLRASFASALKEIVRDMLNRDGVSPVPIPHHSKLTEEMKAVLRPMWQWYGTDWVRNRVDVDYWVNILQWRIRAHDGHVIITDARFPNEIKWGRDNGFVIVRVLGPNYRASSVPYHASELMADAIEVDHEVENFGAAGELVGKAQALVLAMESEG